MMGIFMTVIFLVTVAAICVTVGVIVGGFIDVVAPDSPKRLAVKHVEDFLKSEKFKMRIVSELNKDPKFRFLKRIQARLKEAAPNMTDEDSFNMAKSCLSQLLQDEKIKFGDTRYSWDGEAARIIAEEYEIEYWDAA